MTSIPLVVIGLIPFLREREKAQGDEPRPVGEAALVPAAAGN